MRARCEGNVSLSIALPLTCLATVIILCCVACCFKARCKAAVHVVKQSRWGGKAARLLGRLAKGFERLIVKLKILISSWQILTTIGVVFTIPYPTIYLDFLKVTR